MKKIKWIIIVLILAMIGSFFLNNESENVTASVSTEETNDLEDHNLEESKDGEKEDIIYWIIELKKFLIYLLIISHNIVII